MTGWATFLGQMLGGWVQSGPDGVVGRIIDHFSTHIDVVEDALRNSHRQAWLTIESALAPPSLIGRVRGLVGSADRADLVAGVRAFADDHFRDCPPAKRGRCLQSLRAARRAGQLDLPDGPGTLWPMVREELARLGTSEAETELDRLPLGDDHAELIALISTPQPSGRTLLMELSRVFFLLRVQDDPILSRTLDFIHREQLPERFAQLDTALHTVGEDLSSELAVQRELIESMATNIQRLIETTGLPQGQLSARHSLSIHADAEKQLVRNLLEEFRQLPPDQQGQLVDLEGQLGELLFGSGASAQAAVIFRETAERDDRISERAVAHHNAYRSALERREWESALIDLQKACELDSERFAPFPLDRYEPIRILGAGGFGVVFLCRDGDLDCEVVLKTLQDSELTRDPKETFREAAILRGLRDDRILVPYETGYADRAARSRPYLKMDHFDGGHTLTDRVAEQGTFTPQIWRPIMIELADAMRAAHDCEVLHRDIKPDNVLIDEDFRIRIIDFGLGIPIPPPQESLRSAGDSLLGSSAVGTMNYAPPEQIGERTDVPVGPYSDVYSFGKLCCYALFGTIRVRSRAYRELGDETLAELIEDCIEENPAERPQSFTEVLSRLDAPGTESAPTSRSNPTVGRSESTEFFHTQEVLFAEATEPVRPTPVRSPPAAEIALENALGLRLIAIAPGTYRMGSPPTESNRRGDESPVTVTITKPFWLGAFPVTQRQWRAVMGTQPWEGQSFVRSTDNTPACWISWEAAMEFCRRLTASEQDRDQLPGGYEYTLPSEAEWEYACRAGSNTAYSFGDETEALGDYAWFADNADQTGEKSAHPVGEKRPNAWELHDMHGNVWEWCRDWYAMDLPGGIDPEVTTHGASRVCRGGSWDDSAACCRSATRFRDAPDYADCNLGFRVAVRSE